MGHISFVYSANTPYILIKSRDVILIFLGICHLDLIRQDNI
jgi:hypothetical protein